MVFGYSAIDNKFILKGNFDVRSYLPSACQILILFNSLIIVDRMFRSLGRNRKKRITLTLSLWHGEDLLTEWGSVNLCLRFYMEAKSRED